MFFHGRKFGLRMLLAFMVALSVGLLYLKQKVRPLAVNASQERLVGIQMPEDSFKPRPLKEVRKIVAERNRQTEEAHKKFIDEGWTFVNEAPPVPEVQALDPKALEKHERELQVQLQTNHFSGEMLDRVYKIAEIATNPKTQYVALESLGRNDEPKAQELLIKFYKKVASNSAREFQRQQILQYMKPRSENDSVARFLVGEIANPQNTEALRQQAAAPLIAMSLMRSDVSPTPSASLLSQIPEDQREQFQTLYTAVYSGGIKH